MGRDIYICSVFAPISVQPPLTGSEAKQWTKPPVMAEINQRVTGELSQGRPTWGKTSKGAYKQKKAKPTEKIG